VSVIPAGGRVLLAVALITALAGCSGLGAGAAVPRGDDWTTVAGAGTGAASTNVPEPLMIGGQPVSVVSQQRRRVHASLGIQVFWNSAGSEADMAADANRIFNYVVGLGANSVAIDFWFYTNGVYPSYVYGEPGSTPSPATIAMVVTNAREHGLRVLVRPLLNENNIKIVGNNWRGSIQPPSLTSWFASYYAFLKPYIQAAQRSKATAFNIGTELDSLAGYENHWTIFETAVRDLFTGQQLYAVNYGRWQEDPSYDPVPYPAVDAYPILGLGDGASVSELTSAWVNWLRQHPDSVLRKTVLQEVGIAAAAGAYAEPALVAPSGTPIDVAIQRNWFAAASAAAKVTHLAGLYFYAVNSTDRPSDPALTATYAPGSFIGRSDGVIRACFASGWS
jgi:hypothetical protein